MTELSRWILDILRKDGGQTARVYGMYEQCPWKDLITLEGYKRKVRKIRTKFWETDSESAVLTEDEIRQTAGIPKGFLIDPEPFRAQTSFEESGNEASFEAKTDRIQTLEELLSAARVDLTVWKVDRYVVNKWEMGAVLDGKPVVTPLFQVKANLIRIKLEDPVIPVIQPIKLEPLPRRIREPGNDVLRYLVLGDAQVGYNRAGHGRLIPYHDIPALQAVLQLAATVDFEEIIVLGDMLDLTEMSKYIQKPEFQQTLQPAINYLGDFLHDLREAAPEAHIVYMCGNHEERLQKQLLENFRFAYGLKAYGETIPFYSLRRLLDLDSIDIEFIEDYPAGQHWIADDLVVVHGEYVKLSTVASSSNVSTIMGHLHKEETLTKTYHERQNQRVVKSVTCGCLCRIDGTVPGVIARPSWQNGVVVVERFSKTTNINHISITKGTANYAGLFFDGNN